MGWFITMSVLHCIAITLFPWLWQTVLLTRFLSLFTKTPSSRRNSKSWCMSREKTLNLWDLAHVMCRSIFEIWKLSTCYAIYVNREVGKKGKYLLWRGAMWMWLSFQAGDWEKYNRERDLTDEPTIVRSHESLIKKRATLDKRGGTMKPARKR